VSFPSLSKIAKAYGLRFVRIRNKKELLEKIANVLCGNDPVVCEVMCMRDELVVPTIASFKLPTGQMKSMPPEDMYPFLPWEEFSKLMLVPAVSRTE
jgi:acetolactate synthase-1/2/3 large subunit